MRKLILLQGPSASGKSTWIKRHKLEPYVISADKIREELGYRNVTGISDTSENLMTIMSDLQEKPVWDIFNQFLEKRMANGITTIVDNTNTNFMALRPLRKLAKKYNYQIFTVDLMLDLLPTSKTELTKKYPEYEFQPDLSKSAINAVTRKLLARNDHRGEYRVPDKIITRQVKQYCELWQRILEHPTDWKWLHQVSSNSSQVKSIFWRDQTIDLSKYKKIQVIGDIHNDYSALMRVFDEHEPGTAYIFLGDYLDKGTRPYSTFEFITQELQGTNLFFLRGNHEDFWQNWVLNNKVNPQFEKTLNILKTQYSEKELRKRMIKFLANTKDYMFFKFHDRYFVASHAGLDPALFEQNMNLMPAKSVTYGLSTGFDVHNPYARDIDTLWNNSGIDMYNLHGHRNNFNQFMGKRSINLNYEGEFRWLTIYPDKLETHKIKSIDAPSFEEALRDDPDIRTSLQSSGITAYNFTVNAFIGQRWNQHTSNARGLFIRNSDHSIVGRGFPKFFEAGQIPTAKLENLKFPVEVMRKHDGFLAIVCYDLKTKQIHVYSKRGETDMALLAKEDLVKTGYMDKIKKYYSDPGVRDTTLLFETVDPVNDPHVVKYEKLHTYPIAIVANNREGQWLSSKPDKKHIKNKTFQNWSMFEIDSQSWIDTVNIFGDTPEAKRQALDTLKSLIRQDQLEYPYKEGLVLYGRNMMLKVKTSYYHKAFELATQLDRYEAGHDIKNIWQFGAKNWTKFCLDMQDTHFTPDLALKLEKFDKQYNIHILLKQIHLDRDTINHDKLEEVKKLWNSFK